MKFLYPAFLFALFTIAIPIIIHLFSFRRYKTVYFSNVGFLKDIKKESQKKSKLKQLLILLARILILIFLVFAFSQPYIPVNKNVQKQANQTVAVYVDNSFSMNALSERGQLLEVARNKALEICLAHPTGTKFKLFTNDLKPRHQHLFNKEQFIQQVSEIQSSPVVIPLSLVYKRFAIPTQEDITKNSDKNLYLISDFQRSITDIENFTDETIFTYFLPLLPNQVNNLYIDSCWVEIPAHRLNQEETVFVRIKNNSNEDYQNLPLKLYLNDSLKSISNFSVSAQNEITTSMKYTNNSSGSQLGKIEITDYPFTHDNTWHISYFVEPQLNALVISNNSPESNEGLAYISSLFKNDNYIQLDEMNVQSLQISKLAEYNTIYLLNLEDFSSGFLNELSKVVENGTSVVLFPGIKNNPTFNNNFLSNFGANIVSGTDTTSQEISGIDFDNNFYSDVFKKKEENAVLPKVKGHLKFEENIRTRETNLLWFQNGDKALSHLPFGNGVLWTFSFPLEKKNESFARDVLFVPTIYNIVLNSLPGQQISFTVGKDLFYDIPKNENIKLNSQIEIINKTTGEKFIPGKKITDGYARIEFGDQITEAGYFMVQNNNEIFSALAFNYNRNESDLKYFSSTELNEKIEIAGLQNVSVVQNTDRNFSEIFDEIQNGKQLWKLSILLALFFILIEVLIIRFWK
ncbi:MAG: hypothetical protein HN778_00015 [Prolixibacteraceae bacterium]|jgi:hypothetical protein|nr:hypothetical protein [Prolixibacteraceae bacterium]MBT6763635.1 hypothetical protein [Prolixibacteraceae bacterium]MBT6999298.1 hypothetical protein [Prolixibacteraceae bacterium]MBT7393194.1 hypothetical protein [Prolixibacteraceae bacterium]